MSKKKTIIAISGVSGSGKDEVRKIIEKHVTGTIERINFADKLKQTASLLLNVPVEKFESQEYKNTYLEEWGMTVRQFLQKLGTEAVRNELHTDAWVITYKNDVINSEADIIITTDLRMENEFDSYDYFTEDEYEIITIGIDRIMTMKKWLKLDGILDIYEGEIDNSEFIDIGDYIDALGDALAYNITGVWEDSNNRQIVERIWDKRTHYSEPNIYDYNFEYLITNSGSKEQLEKNISFYLREYNFWIN